MNKKLVPIFLSSLIVSQCFFVPVGYAMNSTEDPKEESLAAVMPNLEGASPSDVAQTEDESKSRESDESLPRKALQTDGKAIAKSEESSSHDGVRSENVSVVAKPEEKSDSEGVVSDVEPAPEQGEAMPIVTENSSLELKIKYMGMGLDALLDGSVLPIDALRFICNQSKEIIKKDPSLVEISGPVIVVGDLHGDVGALERCIGKFFYMMKQYPNVSILFLGDYVDRGDKAPGGPNSLVNSILLFELKRLFPKNVYLLRGNHEDRIVNKIYGFHEECCRKYGPEGEMVWDMINDVFDYLPFAATVADGDNKYFCVHAGIGPDMTLEKIRMLKRPIRFSDPRLCQGSTDHFNNIEWCLLWSDPDESVEKFEDSCSEYDAQGRWLRGRGAGKRFGTVAVKEFLTTNGLDYIIRSHQCIPRGINATCGGRVVTVFSTPCYDPAQLKADMVMLADGIIKPFKVIYNFV